MHDAGYTPHELDYLEAHGIGTRLGDPIEMGAVVLVMGKGRDTATPLVIGAVKANIGHREFAAGIAGVMKAVLVLRYEMATPIATRETLNHVIDKVIKNIRVYCPRQEHSLHELCGKQLNEQPIAGVSSCEYAGTIAHAVLSQPPMEHRRETGSSAKYGELGMASGPMQWPPSNWGLDDVFLNRQAFPWPHPPHQVSITHPLLQEREEKSEWILDEWHSEYTVRRFVEFKAVLHDSLICFYEQFKVQGQVVFRSFGYVERALAAVVGNCECLESGKLSGVPPSDITFTKPHHTIPHRTTLHHTMP